jgi:antitoxin (DNA-binding transcriptional repressor) of toxin-antitoxin stability system
VAAAGHDAEAIVTEASDAIARLVGASPHRRGSRREERRTDVAANDHHTIHGPARRSPATRGGHGTMPPSSRWSVPLVVKLLDSAHRPPAFVMGAHGSSTVLEGDCAPIS